MTLRIDREQRRIRLSGELRCQQLDQVRAEIESCKMPVIFDLRELALVDVESVRFLNACEENGISLLHCSAFLREWMSREISLPKARTRKRKKGRADLEGEHGEHEGSSG
jgi:hypothetical protein